MGLGNRGEHSRGGDSWEDLPDEVAGVPHELAYLIWEQGDARYDERVALAFELYRAMPSYGTLMYLTHVYLEPSDSGRQLVWEQFRELISGGDEGLAQPGRISLRCDFFEDPETVEEAWWQIIEEGRLSRRGLERVLEVSGPVPWTLKAPLYEQLIADERWHPFIFRSLRGGAFDVCGQIAAEEASVFLDQLTLAPDTEGCKSSNANSLGRVANAPGDPG